LIKINLVREGRAVRGTGAAPAAAVAEAGAAGGSNLNNLLIIGLLVVGALVAFGYWFVINQKWKDREATVAARKSEADRLESIIKDVANYQKRKDSLQKRIDLINQLKQNQKGPVHLMDQVSKDLPDLVWLDRMSVAGGGVSLAGRGLNPNAIANFVENIKNDPYFEEPDLGSLTQVSATPPVYSFDMSFHFTYSPKTDTTAGGAATGTSTTGTSATSTSTAPGSQPKK
jgi:type IV pilus assembly protein PilN